MAFTSHPFCVSNSFCVFIKAITETYCHTVCKHPTAHHSYLSEIFLGKKSKQFRVGIWLTLILTSFGPVFKISQGFLFVCLLAASPNVHPVFKVLHQVVVRGLFLPPIVISRKHSLPLDPALSFLPSLCLRWAAVAQAVCPSPEMWQETSTACVA